ncbi:hypothetical protein GCM10009085_22910 [Pseudomonas avellanae]|nr:hypothetical protein GCM10009085_22910 [Pseudomonas avellanae]
MRVKAKLNELARCKAWGKILLTPPKAGPLVLINLKNTDQHATVNSSEVYPANVKVSLQVIMSAGRNAELLAARAPAVRLGKRRPVRFINGQEPFSHHFYLHPVASQQRVIQAESCEVFILRHNKKATPRKDLPLQPIALKRAPQYFSAAALSSVST